MERTDAALVLDFGGEERKFQLLLGEIRELQKRTNAGPHELLRRILAGTWRIDDLRETIRIGLEGGGLPPKEAGQLVRYYVDPPRPLSESVMIAAQILEAALVGVQDDEIPKSAAAEERPQSSRTESSPSPRSTDGDQSSATAQETLTGSRSGNSEPSSPDILPPTAPRTDRSRRQPNNMTTS